MPDVADRIVEGAITIAALIVTVAIVAVLVGRNAQTSGVIRSAGSAYSQDLGTAISPVTGGGTGMGGSGLG